jgi:hypothetical protein
MSIYVYIDILNYGCGSVSHTFGVSVFGCIHTDVNCRLEYIRLILMCMIYQMMVEGILILRVQYLAVFPREGG